LRFTLRADEAGDTRVRAAPHRLLKPAGRTKLEGVFPDDPPNRNLGPIYDRGTVIEARLLLLLAQHSDELVREANRLLGLVEDRKAA
jgi:hypothetical protein